MIKLKDIVTENLIDVDTEVDFELVRSFYEKK